MAQRITARLLQSKTQGVYNDTVVPGLRFIIAAKKRTFRVSPRINGVQHNIKVCAITASNLEEAGEQLVEARDKARDILRDAARGVDPQQAERDAKLAAARARRDTFASVAAGYMDEFGEDLKSGRELQRKLDKMINPTLGHIPVTDVRRSDIKALFLETKETSGPTAANRMLSLIRVVLSYAVDEELIDANPAVGIKKRKETPRARNLSQAEIKSFWNGLDATGAHPNIVRILRALLATGQRRSEVVGMRWSEIDLEKAIWEIPAERTKGNRPHRVPLAPLTLDIIGQPNGGEYVFAAPDEVPFLASSVSTAVTRGQEILGLVERATVHDLRRTMATQLGEMELGRFIIGRLLNHAEQGVTATTYDRFDYAEPKRLAMLAWNNRLVEIATGRPAPENVVAIRSAVR